MGPCGEHGALPKTRGSCVSVFSFLKWDFTRGASAQHPPANAEDSRDVGSVPGLGRSPGGGNGNPLQYSCLKNPMDKGALQATVHGVAKSQTQLSNYTHR